MNHSLLSSARTAELPESIRQSRDLAALSRVLNYSAGTFSLSIAVCSDRDLRNDVIHWLKETHPGLLIVEIPPNTVDVLALVRHAWRDDVTGLFLLDLEASIPFGTQEQPALRQLNSQRELWERMQCPVVIWLAEYAVALLTQVAPDFWRYRSHQFEFVLDKATVSDGLREAALDYSEVEGLPFEAKRFRISELEQRLKEAGENPRPELLMHVLQWTAELANLYRHTGRRHEAEPLLRHALSISESAYTPTSPVVAHILNDLALLLQDCRRFPEAEPLLRKALENNEATYGPNHSDVAVILNNLALVFKASQRLPEAIPLMRQALAINEAAHGPDHPSVATCLNNLALMTDNPSEAESLLRRALAIWERSLGEHHPRVADVLSNLAHLLSLTNRPVEAESFQRRALEIQEHAYGKNHPYVALELNGLADMLLLENRLAEAEPLLRRAVSIMNSSWESESRNAKVIQKNYDSLVERMKI